MSSISAYSAALPRSKSVEQFNDWRTRDINSNKNSPNCSEMKNMGFCHNLKHAASEGNVNDIIKPKIRNRLQKSQLSYQKYLNNQTKDFPALEAADIATGFYYDLGLIDEASRLFKIALEKSDDSLSQQSILNACVCLLQNGEEDKAWAIFKKKIKDQTNGQHILQFVIPFFFKKEQWQKVVNLFSRLEDEIQEELYDERKAYSLLHLGRCHEASVIYDFIVKNDEEKGVFSSADVIFGRNCAHLASRFQNKRT